MNIGKIEGIGGIGNIEKPQAINNKEDAGFSENIKGFIKSIDEIQNQADMEIKKSLSGTETDIASLMITSLKAEISMQLTLQIRNKIIESYNEIIKMPI